MTRVELYEAVWSRPMIHLAAEYGASDNGLRDLCIRMKIPTPYRGYWRQLQIGHAPPRTPLPEPEHNPPVVMPGASEKSVSSQGATKSLEEAPATTAVERKPVVVQAEAQGVGIEYLNLGKLAGDFERFRQIDALLNAVAAAATSEMPAAVAVSQHWLGQMRRRNARENPVKTIVEALEAASLEPKPPPWWGGHAP